MNKKIIIIALIMGITAIILGAFGAHALKELLNTQQLATFETGIRYQMYHALFLLFLGNYTDISQKTKKIVFISTIIGVLFFSGSIYFLSTNQITTIEFGIIGIITPIGGLFLIFSWIFLLYKIIMNKLTE